MKYIWKILYIIVGILLVFTTYRNAQAGDVCQTIVGCFAMWLWVHYRDRNS